MRIESLPSSRPQGKNGYFFKRLCASALLGAAVCASAAALAAGPSVDDVYRAAEAGNYSQAQSLMDQVLREHPDSGRAHFIEAELLAKQGKLPAARGELDQARQLAPGLPFAQPGAVQELQAVLSGGAGIARAGGMSIPWMPVLLILAGIVLVLLYLRPRQGAIDPGAAGIMRQGGYPMPGGPGYGPGYGSGYGPGGAAMGGGMGSGIMGGLATGAAVGAGMVAGEALMHRVLGGGQPGYGVPVDPGAYAQGDDSTYDMGGNDFGVDDAGSWDDSSGDGGWDDGGSST